MSSPRSPAAAPPLDDDNLLAEILLRLHPQPSSLPRASLVCKGWRSVGSDPAFSRRFRRHHRRNPPLLGFFHVDVKLSFVPTLKAPNRVSPERFSWQRGGDRFKLLGCRHGLALIFNASRNQVLVWDPVTGDQHHIAIPPGLEMEETPISGAVFRAARDAKHFRVALVGNREGQIAQAVARVYSSETGLWGDLISTPLPSEDPAHFRVVVCTIKPAVMIEDSFYWVLMGSSDGILEFDLDRQKLSVIPMPVCLYVLSCFHFSIIRAGSGGLGFLFLSGFNAQFWKRKTDFHGVTSWLLGRTIEIDRLLPSDTEQRWPLRILGFAEENNVALIWTHDVLFMIQLKSLKFEKLLGIKTIGHFHSFESVHTAETGIDGGLHGHGADLLHNT